MSSSEMEALTHLAHKLLFAFVRHCDVLDKARKVGRPISGQYEGVTGLSEEVDEVAIVSR